MNDNYDFSEDKSLVYKLCYACIIGIAVCIVIALLTSCKSVEYVPVVEHEVHHDSIYFTNVQIDSIYIKDSTFQKEYSRNDTFFIEKIKWHIKYKEKLVHDTSYVSKIDSIPVPYPVVKEVEKKLSKTQKGLMSIGGLSILGILIFAIDKIRKFLP